MKHATVFLILQPSSFQISQVVEWKTRCPQKAVPTRREGSSPSLATFFRGRLTAGRRALTPQVLAQLQPPEFELVASGQWLVPNEQAVDWNFRPTDH
jgi:hypothetical protein